MKPLADAQRRILEAMDPLPGVRVPLADALGLALAAPVEARHDLPSFANSAMDGFAVRAADTRHAPVTLRVVDDIPAGSTPQVPVGRGEAARIMTGAAIPAGADAVVKVESTAEEGGRVRVLVPVDPETAIRPAGGDVAAGARVLEAGERLGPAHLGLLAALGVSLPLVHRRPRVAVLSTGDEVRPADTVDLPPGAIRDANRPMVVAMATALGAEVVDMGIVPDDAARLRASLEEAAGLADAVLTSGGVSMGAHDLVKQVLGEMGSVEFWKVAMQPAKPFAFGFIGGTPFFGLPGNPVSVMVAFEQFVRPALLRRMGSRFLFRIRLPGVITQAVATDPEKTVFLRVTVTQADGAWSATLSGGQSSNVLSALARAPALAVIPAGVGAVRAGGAVELEMIGWPEGRTAEEVLGWKG